MSVFTDKEIEELKDTFKMCDLNQDVRPFFRYMYPSIRMSLLTHALYYYYMYFVGSH